MQALVDELPSAAPFVCDLTDEASVAAAAGAIDRLDVLVHSAGLSSHGTLAETPAEDWRRLYEMNVVAVATLTRLLLPRLREAHGQVVTINSGSGFTSKPGNGVYSASKFALRALTDALREEERGTVRVSSIHPGRVDTTCRWSSRRSSAASTTPTSTCAPRRWPRRWRWQSSPARRPWSRSSASVPS